MPRKLQSNRVHLTGQSLTLNSAQLCQAGLLAATFCYSILPGGLGL